MNPEDILGSILRGAIGSRGVRKSSRKTLGAVTRGALANPQVLLTMAGVAWGVWETWKGGQGAAQQPPPAGAGVPPIPPLPGEAASNPGDAVLRLVRLMISAAGADGKLGPQERAAILDEATKAGIGPTVEAELSNPRPLAQIVAGVQDQATKAELYKLAFAIVRADEGVSGAERIYLAQLAHSLGLADQEVARIESAAGSAIDAAPSA